MEIVGANKQKKNFQKMLTVPPAGEEEGSKRLAAECMIDNLV